MCLSKLTPRLAKVGVRQRDDVLRMRKHDLKNTFLKTRFRERDFMIQKILALGCGVPFFFRAAWAFSHSDPKAGILGLMFGISNLIIFW